MLSGLATSITDWLFMGVLFHDKYLATAEIWRLKSGQSETRSIALSTLFGVVSCAAFLYLCIWRVSPLAYAATLHMAFWVWLAGPLPLIFINVVWIRMHPLVAVSHSFGWLARFVVTGLIGSWLIH